MTSEVLVVDDPRWGHFLNEVHPNDVFFTAEYHRAYQANGDGTALAFVATQNDDVLIHPFMLRPIQTVLSLDWPSGKFDIESVNGYTGPLARGAEQFINAAWLRYSQWCREHGVVAEFTRFHPLLSNERFAAPGCIVSPDRDLVVVDLTLSQKERWATYSSVQRNMVRKALKNDVRCEVVELAEGLPLFQAMYEESMQRLGARRELRFSESYFEQLRRLPEPPLLFAASLGGGVVAAAIFLRSQTFLHYHLAATVWEKRGYAASNLILDQAAQWGHDHGLLKLHLGGGRSASHDDELFRFKAQLSPIRVPYILGRQIHDPAAYSELCEAWADQTGELCPANYFFGYRSLGPRKVETE